MFGNLMSHIQLLYYILEVAKCDLKFWYGRRVVENHIEDIFDMIRRYYSYICVYISKFLNS